MIAKRLLATITVLAAATIPTLAAPARAQELTVERIYASRDFTPEQVQLAWLADGRGYTVLERDRYGRTDLFEVDVRSGRRELLVRGADLVPPGAERPVRISSYRFARDGKKLLIAVGEQRIWRRSRRATYYVWDLERRTLTPVSARPGYQRNAKFSPDGGRVAFVRDNDIYVTDLATGEERALTSDGSEDVINGASDWVYEEELSLVDGFRWSPDGARIAFWRFDQSAIPPFYLIDELPLYPTLEPVRYPKAGTANSEVRLGVVELASGATTWIETGGVGDEYYITRMDFAGSPDEIWFQTLNRHQNRMDLYIADVRTGAARLILTDRDDAWLDLYPSRWPHRGEPWWIEGGRRFLYLSERDGYLQLYLFNRDGTRVRKLTTGKWDVLGIYGVDERRGVVYFTGAADGPLVRPIYRIGLDGKGLTRISEATGTHRARFDPTFTYYLDSYSEAGVPPVQTIHRAADGERVRTLEENAALVARLEALELERPEFIEVPLDDGTRLNAWMIKPPDFDPAKRYPLLMYVYGGPGSQTVTDSWGGDRYMWHQLLAREGYLVASVDNRGTGARGARFKKITYLQLGRYESADQIAAARYFASLPYVDEARIGIWGWSYGGYMASLSLFKGAGVFRAGIAVAPVTDWRLYDTIYTERYMRTPAENPAGYAAAAPQSYADRLQGAFLLVHGTGDDNVHAQNSYQLVQRLIDANKQFDFRLYPNKTHAIAGPTARVNLFTMMTEFVRENL